MKMILLGAPGAGKGTQAERLCKVLNIPTISTGNILRAAVKNGTPTGKQAEAYMKAGKLVPDEVIIGIIHDRLDEPMTAERLSSWTACPAPSPRLSLWRRPGSGLTT